MSAAANFANQDAVFDQIVMAFPGIDTDEIGQYFDICDDAEEPVSLEDFTAFAKYHGII